MTKKEFLNLTSILHHEMTAHLKERPVFSDLHKIDKKLLEQIETIKADTSNKITQLERSLTAS